MAMMFQNLGTIASGQRCPIIDFVDSSICPARIENLTGKAESTNQMPFENKLSNELQVFRDPSWILKSLYRPFIPPTDMAMMFQNLRTISSKCPVIDFVDNSICLASVDDLNPIPQSSTVFETRMAIYGNSIGKHQSNIQQCPSRNHSLTKVPPTVLNIRCANLENYAPSDSIVSTRQKTRFISSLVVVFENCLRLIKLFATNHSYISAIVVVCFLIAYKRYRVSLEYF